MSRRTNLSLITSAVLTALNVSAAYAGVTTTGNVTPDPTTSDYETTLRVGSTSDGTMTINGGSSVASYFGYVGSSAGATGVATVTGAGSTWNNSTVDDTYLFIGHSGTGTLNIENGGTVNSLYTYVGRNASGVGTLNVKGTGSTFNMTDTMWMGYSGTGNFNVTEGGYAHTIVFYAGRNAGSSASMKVDGAGSYWNNYDGLGVGWEGHGDLSITNGGVVTIETNTFIAANSADSTGWALVDGAGSTWNNGELYVGTAGVGSATFSNGGKAIDTYGYVGTHTGAVGTVDVTGKGSEWRNSSDLYVGYEGTGTLNISNGATVSNARGYLGANPGGVGIATVDGGGSTWTINDETDIGSFGSGTLTVTNGGVVNSLTRTYVGAYGGTSSATVSGAGSSWFIGGQLLIGYQASGTLNIAADGLVDVQDNISISGYETGAGAVNLTGGTLNMHGHDIVAGPGATPVFVFTGGSLQNVGTFGFDLNQQGGTLAAGASPGEMIITGDYTLGAMGTLQVELAGTGGVAGTDFDFYSITGDATLAGILEVLPFGGFTPGDGLTFNVLTAETIDITGLSLLNSGYTFSVVPGGNGEILQIAVAVPEPTGLLAMTIAGAGLLKRRRAI